MLIITSTLIALLIKIHAAFVIGGKCIDSLPDACQTQLRVRPSFCYTPHNYDLCCATCNDLMGDNPDCPYGDRQTIIEQDGVTYNCAQYVRNYGRWRCNEPAFRRQCCHSCNGFNTWL